MSAADYPAHDMRHGGIKTIKLSKPGINGATHALMVVDCMNPATLAQFDAMLLDMELSQPLPFVKIEPVADESDYSVKDILAQETALAAQYDVLEWARDDEDGAGNASK